MSEVNELVDKYINIIQEQNAQESELSVSEDLGSLSAPLAGAIALAVVFIPHFRRLRKMKKAAKETCKKYTGVENKKCLIRVDIALYKKELAAIRQGLAKCGTHRNPSKCRVSLKAIITDFQNKIKELQRKMAKV